MEAKAYLRNLRMSPKKVRLVAGLIRGKKAFQAKRLLGFTNKAAARPVVKLLESAMANARNVHGADQQAVENMHIAHITVDMGTAMKRWMPKAHGRATMIRKRFSHITLVLSDEPFGLQKKKKAAASAEASAKEQKPAEAQSDAAATTNTAAPKSAAKPAKKETNKPAAKKRATATAEKKAAEKKSN